MEHCFKAFLDISILIVECKLKFCNAKERLESIGKVLAECYVCNWRNSEHQFSVPVYAIVCDNDSFQFFRFDGSTQPPSFYCGILPGENPTLQGVLRFGQPWETRPVIHSLRKISEVIFDLLLRGYLSSLYVRHDHIKESGPEHLSIECDNAIKAAEDALGKFQYAESQRQEGNVVGANETVQNALASLKLSVETAPILDRHTPIMRSWDDNVIDAG